MRSAVRWLQEKPNKKEESLCCLLRHKGLPPIILCRSCRQNGR